MKKFLVFLVTFVVLYVSFDILSGIILTAWYEPDMERSSVNQVLSIAAPSTFPIIIGTLSATLAYFLAYKAVKEE